MKRLIIFSVLFFILITTTTFAQIKVVKGTVSGFQTGIGTLFPQIAQNTSTGESLVVWCVSNQNDGGCGQIFGRLLDPKGKAKTAASVLFSDFWNFDPALAYNPVQNE